MMKSDDRFVGGHAILDFVNTVKDQEKSRNLSVFNDFSSFLQWSNDASIFNEDEVNALVKLDDTLEGEALARIHLVREMLYSYFVDLIPPHTGSCIMSPVIELKIKNAIQNSELVKSERGYHWAADLNSEYWFINKIFLLTEEFLRTCDLTKLRQCGRCSWLFLNNGRGNGRKWCKMSTCGNRAKSTAFRKRSIDTD